MRLVTCVYYLNKDWEPAHGGQLRVYVSESPSSPSLPSHWDVPPKLDTLVMFRSLDVEHEVLPTFHERMALTIWYYGRVKSSPLTQQHHQQKQREDPLALVKKLLLSPAPSAVSVPTPQRAPSASLPPPPAPELLGSSVTDTIFVAIPSYRDSECRHTVDDLLLKAHHPERVRVGVCLQQSEDDGEDDPREYFASKYSPAQVRVKWVDYRHAAGPCVARAEAQKLWEGEAFYLQIDSHMRFRHGWDAFLIAELAKCPSAKPILTTYPLGYTLPNNVRAREVDRHGEGGATDACACGLNRHGNIVQVSSDVRPTLLCASRFDENGILRQSSKTLSKTSPVYVPVVAGWLI